MAPAPASTRTAVQLGSSSPISPAASRKRLNSGFLKAKSYQDSHTPNRFKANLNEQFEEHDMITTTVDEVFKITIQNFSKRRLSLDNYHLKVFSSKVKDYPLPRGIYVDASGEITLTSRSTQGDYECGGGSENINLKRSVPKLNNSTSVRNSIMTASANEIYMPELRCIFSINFPPRSIHLISDSGIHVCECIEGAVLRGVFPEKKIASDDRFEEEMMLGAVDNAEGPNKNKNKNKPSRCTLM